MFLEPTDASAIAFFGRQIQGPVTMLNLLRFKEIADYSASPELSPAEPISGREAYEIYMAHTAPFLAAAGGRLRYVGLGGHFLIGPEEERWDMAMLVEHANASAFMEMADDSEYLSGLGHRTAALEDSRLLPLETSSV